MSNKKSEPFALYGAGGEKIELTVKGGYLTFSGSGEKESNLVMALTWYLADHDIKHTNVLINSSEQKTITLVSVPVQIR